VDENDLALYIRTNIRETDVIENLAPTDYKNVYTHLLSTPEIQVEEDDIPDRKDWIVGSDGYALSVTSGKTCPISPDDFIRTHIAVPLAEINPNGGKRFDRFLHDISGGNADIEQLLLELIGVVISGYKVKKFFVLQGPSGSGKSTFANLLLRLVGKTQTVLVNNLNALAADPWMLGSLAGKKLCLSPDHPNETIRQLAADTLKLLTGEKFAQGNRKYRDPFEFLVELTLVIGTNFALHFTPGTWADKAFRKRMVVIPFLNSIPESSQVEDLVDLLMDEAGYIIHRAREALCDLMRRNWQFTTVNATIPEDAPVQSASIEEIIAQVCVFDAEAHELSSVIYAKIIEACGGGLGMSPADFGKYLTERYGLLSTHTKHGSGRYGIRLKTVDELSATS
jgi:putative DNA primase/helicase